MRDVAIVGIGRTEYNRASGRTPMGLAVEATRSALADAGLQTSDLDGVAAYGMNDSIRSFQLGRSLGLEELAWAVDLFGGGNACCSTVLEGFAAVGAGRCETAVVLRSMNGRSGARHGRGLVRLSGELQFSALHGYIVPPMWLAMWARTHMERYGTTEEDLAHIAVTQRTHALANDHAMQRTPMTMDDYLDGRWIYEPLRIYDCCLESDGACALVITTLERARDLPHAPIRPLASAEAFTHGGTWDQFPDMSTMYSSYAAPRLWSRTDLRPDDVDVACLYDCFTYTVMATFEDYGFCEKGGVGEYFAGGRATYGGDVVVNPHGGLLSEAYIHGLNHHYESTLQLRGEAGERQVEGAEIALVTGGAGAAGGAILYGRDR